MSEPPDGAEAEDGQSALSVVGVAEAATYEAGEIEAEANQWRSLRDKVWDGRYVADLRARYCLRKAKSNATYQKVALIISLASQSGTIWAAFNTEPWLTTSLSFIAAVVGFAAVSAGWNAQQAKLAAAAAQFQEQHSAWDKLWREVEFAWPPDDFDRRLEEAEARDNAILAAAGEPGDVKLISRIQREINAAMNPKQLAERGAQRGP